MKKTYFSITSLLDKDGFDFALTPTIIISASNTRSGKIYCILFAFLFWNIKVSNH